MATSAGLNAVEASVRRVTQHADFPTKFKHPVKFNGTDFVEQRLTVEQQFEEVSKNAAQNLHIFLERYGTLLQSEDLHALVGCSAANTPEARFWLERLLKKPLSNAEISKRSRRRRWMWAKREMARASGFFSEEEMKNRDPMLFHRVVGQHLDTSVQLSAPMQGGLSNYLMQQLDKECDAESILKQPARAAASSEPAGGYAQGPPKRHRVTKVKVDLDEDDLENDFDDYEMDLASGDEDAMTGADDVVIRREKFLKMMRDRFMDGQERDFNYAILDEDSDLDDVVELGRDAEDRYFDDD